MPVRTFRWQSFKQQSIPGGCLQTLVPGSGALCRPKIHTQRADRPAVNSHSKLHPTKRKKLLHTGQQAAGDL